MQSVRMRKQRVIWMREKGFDRIEVIIEMHEETLRRLYAGFDPELLCNGLYSPRRQPTLDELALDMEFEVENLKLKVLLSQLPPPPQYCLSPRRSPAALRGGPNPEFRTLKCNKWRRRELYLFKSVSMAFCTLIHSRSRNRRELHILSSRRRCKP